MVGRLRRGSGGVKPGRYQISGALRRKRAGEIRAVQLFIRSCTWPSWPSPVGLRSQTALTVILLGFNNDRAGRMALFAHARRVAALSRCGELARVRTSAAAAVRFRSKASGRHVVRRVSHGCRRARLLLCAPTLPSYRVPGHRGRIQAA